MIIFTTVMLVVVLLFFPSALWWLWWSDNQGKKRIAKLRAEIGTVIQQRYNDGEISEEDRMLYTIRLGSKKPNRNS